MFEQIGLNFKLKLKGKNPPLTILFSYKDKKDL